MRKRERERERERGREGGKGEREGERERELKYLRDCVASVQCEKTWMPGHCWQCCLVP